MHELRKGLLLPMFGQKQTYNGCPECGGKNFEIVFRQDILALAKKNKSWFQRLFSK
jgi:hypothetical protein